MLAVSVVTTSPTRVVTTRARVVTTRVGLVVTTDTASMHRACGI